MTSSTGTGCASLWDPSNSHLLSKKAKEEHWDTFIFCPNLLDPGNLLIGFNTSQHRSTLSCARFLRWLRILDSNQSRTFIPKLYLSPATIHIVGVLQYLPQKCEDSIQPDDTEPMRPGNYMIEGSQISPSVGGQETSRAWTVGTQESGLLSTPPLLPAACCRITGLTSDLQCVTIVPAHYAAQEEEGNYDATYDATFALHATSQDNSITLHKGLIDAFEENRFSIDVDDSYRIVILRSIPPESQVFTLLKNIEYLPDTADITKNCNKYLRYHFKMSLEVHCLGGDINFDYSQAEVLGALDKIADNPFGFSKGEITPLKIAVEMDYMNVLLQTPPNTPEEEGEEEDADNT